MKHILTLYSTPKEILNFLKLFDNFIISLNYKIPENVEIFIIDRQHSIDGLKGRAVSGKRNRIFLFRSMFYRFISYDKTRIYMISEYYQECVIHEYCHIILDLNESYENAHCEQFWICVNKMKYFIE